MATTIQATKLIQLTNRLIHGVRIQPTAMIYECVYHIQLTTHAYESDLQTMWFLFSCTKEQEVGLMTVQSMWPSTRYTHMLYTVETGSSSPHTRPITQWMHYTALFSTSMLIIPNMDCIHFCFPRYTVYCQHVPRIPLLSLSPPSFLPLLNLQAPTTIQIYQQQ